MSQEEASEVPGNGWPKLRLYSTDVGKIFCVCMMPKVDGSSKEEVPAVVARDQVENFIRTTGRKVDFRVITEADVR